MRALVVINPVSGPGRGRPVDECGALARVILGRHGFDVDVVATTARGDARTFSERARADGVRMVLAWGGDGTINEVASGVAFSDVWLGIVPGGSGNGLARELGVPLDPARALELAATGRTRVIDAGQIDEALFFNVAGVGLDAEIARRIAEPGRRRGLVGYVQVTLSTIVRYRAERLAIESAGASIARRVLFVAVANSRQYGNGAQIAPAARLDDGRLDLVVVEPQSAWRLMARLPAFFRGTLAPGGGLHMSQVEEAVISGDGPLCFHVDGEPYLGDDDLHIRARPGALRIRTA